LIVGSENTNGDVTINAILTSEKGMKVGIASFHSTTKLSDTQPISGETKGQYAKVITPCMYVKEEDFVLHAVATEYANTPEIKGKLQEMQKISDRYVPVKYNTEGITIEILQNIKDRGKREELRELNTKGQNFENIICSLLLDHKYKEFEQNVLEKLPWVKTLKVFNDKNLIKQPFIGRLYGMGDKSTIENFVTILTDEISLMSGYVYIDHTAVRLFSKVLAKNFKLYIKEEVDGLNKFKKFCNELIINKDNDVTITDTDTTTSKIPPTFELHGCCGFTCET